MTDQFAWAPIVEDLSRRGIRCIAVNWTPANKADSFSWFKAKLNTGELRLVGDERLLRELGDPVATPAASGFHIEGGGRDDVAHPAVLAVWRVGQHLGFTASEIRSVYYLARCGCRALVTIPPWIYASGERACSRCGGIVCEERPESAEEAGRHADETNPWMAVYGNR